MNVGTDTPVKALATTAADVAPCCVDAGVLEAAVLDSEVVGAGVEVVEDVVWFGCWQPVIQVMRATGKTGSSSTILFIREIELLKEALCKEGKTTNCVQTPF